MNQNKFFGGPNGVSIGTMNFFDQFSDDIVFATIFSNMMNKPELQAPRSIDGITGQK